MNYDNDYVSWKNWGSKFGECTKADFDYFEGELMRTGLDLSKPLRVLEIGFGDGNFLAYCEKKNWSVKGLELNSELVDFAKKAGFSCTHYFDAISLLDENFDLIVAFDVIEHMSSSEIFDFMNLSKRLLAIGGIILIRIPNGDSPFGRPLQNGDFSHVTEIGSEKVKYLCSRFNFEVVFLGGQYLLPSKFLSIKIFRIIGRSVNIFLNYIVYGGVSYELISPNLVCIVKKIKEK